MSELDKFVLDYEAEEEANDMHFSLYSVPSYFNEEENE